MRLVPTPEIEPGMLLASDVAVDTLRRVVAPYPPGSEIRLSDGRRGLVVTVPLDDVDRPRVRVLWDATGRRVEPEEIDLRERPLLAPGLAAA